MFITPTRIENLLVVKIGGGDGLDLARCIRDVAEIARQRPVIIVHGASAAMNALCNAQGIEVQTLVSPTGHSSRYTSPAIRNLFVEAAHQVNATVVSSLQSRSVNAVSMIGERVVIKGERKDAIRAVVNGRIRLIRDDFSGSISSIDVPPLLEQLEAGLTPVLPPLALNEQDGMLNIDGDRASAAVAGAIGAAELVILTNVRGLYRQYPDESTFVSRINASEMRIALEWAEGRMKRKVLGASEALEQGVQRVIIADGRSDAPIQGALNGYGTEFVA